MKEKRCSKCKEVFPRTSEYYYINSDGKVPARCKKCSREDQRERDRKKREKKGIVKPPGKPRTAEVFNEGTQECRLCGEEFPLTSEYFCVNESYKTGLTTRCRTCQNAYDREKYAKRKAEGRGRKYTPDPRYAELLEDKYDREEEAYKRMINQKKDKGIGDKEFDYPLVRGKKYKVIKIGLREGQIRTNETFTGELAQITDYLFTLKCKAGYCESFLKKGYLLGEIEIREV